MKKSLITLFAILAVFFSAGSQAHPMGGHWGGGHWGGWRGGYAAPALVAGVVGASVYAASQPYYYPVPYVGSSVAMPSPALNYYPSTNAPVAYYCQTYQQYFPQVTNCPTPWQLVQ